MPLEPTGRKHKARDSRGKEHWLIEYFHRSEHCGFHPVLMLEDGRQLKYSVIEGTARLVLDDGEVYTLEEPPQVVD